MTDTTPPVEGDESASTESKPNWRRELESRAKAGDEAVTKLEALERREVFRDAGLDLANKATGYFVKGYDGDLTVDAIKTEAAAAGFGPTVSTTPDVAVEQLGGEGRIAEAADDAGPVTDPELNDLIAKTTSPEELRTLMESRGYLFSAAE